MDQWQLEEFAKVRRNAKIMVVTDGLPPETLRRLFVEPAASVEAAVAEALARIRPERHDRRDSQRPYVMAEVG